MHWKQKLAKEISDLEKLDQTRSVRAKLSRLRRKAISNPNGSNQQARKTHCPKGHRYTKKNVYQMKDGSKRCKICHRAAAMRYYTKNQKKKAA